MDLPGARAVVTDCCDAATFACALGIPCVTAAAEDTRALGAAIEADPSAEVEIDVDALRVTCGDLSFPVHMPDSAREALIGAQWDPIAELLDGADAVAERVKALGYA